MDVKSVGGSVKKAKPAPRVFRSEGTQCVWPSGAQKRYGVSAPTLWRWEKDGKLPPRDVFVGGKPVGWRPETLDAADRGEATKAAA